MRNVMQEKKGLSGSTLKLIAIITMFIDHIGAVIVERMLYVTGNTGSFTYEQMQNLDTILRSIGRIGFPLFCFLLVEGFLHTRNLGKYALRLLVFAVVSELPFNLAFTGQLFFAGYQNVFFTLFIGLITMWGCRMIEEKTHFHIVLQYGGCLLVVVAGAYLAELMQTDYAGIGVLCIMALYLFRKNRLLQALAGAVSFCWEIPAPLAFVPVAFYNGKRGLKMKYFFYVFYPAHLLVLYLIAYFCVLT
ncbi:MAG: conjugal transfer protein TraX [Lachnospiraceae bacterium]|nr:conjugal transfer protein TraX [Lachnospiraceae bacterium]